MSRLRIEHQTIYTYRRPVGFERHRLVLRPREGHDLRVERMTVEISPAHRLLWTRDIFGNSVAMVDFAAEADRLEVNSVVELEQSPPLVSDDPDLPIHVPLPIVYDERETPVIAAYQAFSFPHDIPAVHRWLAQFPDLAGARDAETALVTLCALINCQIKYQRRPSRGTQSPAETLSLGSGSCRDTATLMMDAARSLGLAARFASGYLDCPAAEQGRASMHAWTEVYLPVLGWRGFDPSIGEPASLKHIAVGVSCHPRGVMPVSGTFNGTSADFLDMTATVKIERLCAIPAENGNPKR